MANYKALVKNGNEYKKYQIYTPIAKYTFDNDSGSIIVDSQGLYNGNAVGTTLVTGYNGTGNARYFNGVNDRITFASRVIPIGAKSIRFKIRTTNYGSVSQRIIANATGAPDHGDVIHINPNGQLSWNSCKGSSSDYRFAFNSGISIVDGQWHDILLTWDGTTNENGVKMYIDDMLTPVATATANALETNQQTYNLMIGKQANNDNTYFFKGELDEIVIYNTVYNPNDEFTWVTVTNSIPSEHDFLNGMEATDVKKIPESAWSELSNEIELQYYTDDQNIIEISFNIETNPFTLAEEFDEQQIKILHYTGDQSITESLITTEIEPVLLLDELGNTFEILYYTDDTTKTEADVVITANYSPLDEIDGDFDIVTFIKNEYINSLNIEMRALPKGQLIINDNIEYFGDFQQFVVQTIDNFENMGVVRFLISFDGVTWESYNGWKWRTIDVSNKDNIKKYGMNVENIMSITPNVFNEKIIDKNNLKLAYYIEEDIYENKPSRFGEVKIQANAYVNDTKVSDLAFYILNTTATININFVGNKITGVLDDEDKGKVRYRVLLNNEPYYPADGNFTALTPSPLDINIVIDDRKILFNQQNTLTVEFEDYWGHTDSWVTTFIGTYSGLMFMDENGEYYSDSFGEVLKYLDFGQIIAGQTSLDRKVILKNQLGYDIQNITLEAIQPETSGVVVELSKQQSPFIPLTSLNYSDVLTHGNQIEFFVRLSSEITSTPVSNGNFEIRVKADKVVI